MGDKHSSKKLLATIVGLVVAIIAATGVVVATHPPQAKVSVVKPGASQPAKSPSTHLQYKGQTGKTALELLKSHAQVVIKQASFGEYVESIDGVTAGVDDKHWTFYVNGAHTQVGAGVYITQPEDTIEWKFE